MVRQVIHTFFSILVWLIIIRVILSWIRPSAYNRTYYEIRRVIFRLTEPILEPIRDRLPPMGTIDLSPLVAVILLQIVEVLVLRLVGAR